MEGWKKRRIGATVAPIERMERSGLEKINSMNALMAFPASYRRIEGEGCHIATVDLIISKFQGIINLSCYGQYLGEQTRF